TLRANPNSDPNDALASQIEQRKRQIFNINGTLKKSAAELISPHTMLNMLQQALAEHPGITLVSATKAEPTRFSLSGQAQSLAQMRQQDSTQADGSNADADPLNQRYGL